MGTHPIFESDFDCLTDTMAGAGDVTVPQLFTELQKSIQKGDQKSIIKFANMILHTKEGHADPDALQCKVIALLEMDKYAECIKAITEFDLAQFNMEKAYCFYRLGDNDAALALLVNGDDLREIELKAQILFRLEQWQEAYEIYSHLLRNCADEFEQERVTNLVACAAMIAQFDDGTNAAATIQLSQAEKLCRAQYDDDEELQQELAQVRLQMGYCAQMAGKRQESQSAYSLVMDTSVDALVTALASHNLGTIDQKDARKKMKPLQATNVDGKLTKSQKQTTKRNRTLLALYAGKPAECRKILGESGGESADAAIINASILFQEKEYEQASSELIKWGNENARTELALIKAAEMFIESGQLANCAKMLSILPEELKYSTTVTDMLIDIYSSLDNKAKALEILDASIAYQKSQNGSNLIAMLRLSARWKLDTGDAPGAAQMLSEIHRAHPDDVAILAELIGAYASFDQARAAQESAKLPSLETLTEGVNVDEIEQWAKRLGYNKVEKKVVETPKAAEKEETIADMANDKKKEKRKKKQKPRYPKNMVPGAPIDSERWLPLRQRSYYKFTRRDKHKAKIGKGSQGQAGASKITDSLDMSKKSTATPTSPKATATESPAGPRKDRPKPKITKKKNTKGKKKW